MARILLVEDNRDLAFGLRTNLEIEGHTVEVAEDGPTGLARARATRPDLLILDLTLPGIDGFRVLHTLRDEAYTLPVLILTARGEETDKVLGFRAGADDYVTKPFSVLELLARVKALLRRAEGMPLGEKTAGDDGRERFGDIEVDRVKRTVFRQGEPVPLSPKAFDLLLALLRRGGKAAPRRELLREVWGHHADVATRTVDTHIAELRSKLEDDSSQPRYILTVRKVGYRLSP